MLSVAQPLPPLLRDLVVILSAAAAVAIVLQRLRLATIPAYLITGAIIGPGALRIVSDPNNVAAVSNLAIILLLFGIGLQMDVSVLARGFRQVLLGTVVSTAACTLALWPIGAFLGGSAVGALVIAVALANCSTVVVLRVLQQRRELGHPHGRMCFGVLILQDLMAVGLMMLFPPLALLVGTGAAGAVDGAPRSGTYALFVHLILNGLLVVGGIGGIVLFGRYVLPRLLSEAARQRSAEVLIVLTTAVALAAAALTHYLIGNAALGAFLAGFLISNTPFRHHLSAQVGAIRDLFSAAFFTVIGMTVSLEVLREGWLVIIGCVAALHLLKSVLTMLSLWAVGATGNVAFRAGWALSQAGEFSVVMLSAASAPAIGLIDRESVGRTIAVVVLSLFVTPGLMQAASALSERLPRIRPPRWTRQGVDDDARVLPRGAAAGGERPLHALIAGFGLVGRNVADELKKIGATYTIIELNPATIRKQVSLGREVIYGDVSSEEVLRQAGIEHADLLVLTIPDPESVLRACRLARQIKPGILIIARANYVSQGIVAAGMGADGVVVEEMATAMEMERVLHKALERRRRDLESAKRD